MQKFTNAILINVHGQLVLCLVDRVVMIHYLVRDPVVQGDLNWLDMCLL